MSPAWLPLLAEVDLTSPTSLLYAAVLAEGAVIAFLIAWIRTLYQERRIDQEEELKHRDDLLERVLGAIAKLAEAVAVVSAKGRAE